MCCLQSQKYNSRKWKGALLFFMNRCWRILKEGGSSSWKDLSQTAAAARWVENQIERDDHNFKLVLMLSASGAKGKIVEQWKRSMTLIYACFYVCTFTLNCTMPMSIVVSFRESILQACLCWNSCWQGAFVHCLFLMPWSCSKGELQCQTGR